MSLVSLAGGASLGPEDALGKMGGGLGTWVSERQKLSEDVRATNTLSGMSAAYGGLLSSPILASVLTLEVARPKAARFADTLVAGLLASTVAFAVYFPIAGSTFVGIYALPSYEYESWQLLAAVPLGLVAGDSDLRVVAVVQGHQVGDERGSEELEDRVPVGALLAGVGRRRLGHEAAGDAVPVLGVERAQVAVLQLADVVDVDEVVEGGHGSNVRQITST